VYQPEMSEENVRRLYYLKVEKRKPMTKLLNQILEEYFQQHEQQDKSEEGGKEGCTNARSAETHSKPNC
jgi:mRNA-degrading endonuclease RelE of RelBE toxin-antitoxin system